VEEDWPVTAKERPKPPKLPGERQQPERETPYQPSAEVPQASWEKPKWEKIEIND
jgi:hypothetical protein